MGFFSTMMASVMPLTASAATTDATSQSSIWALLLQMAPLLLIFVAFYFILIRPQKKKEKQVQAMRNNLEVGDEIVTSGGIIGIVVSIKEDTVVLETGGDRSKIRVKRWAIQDNLTIHDTQA